MTNQIESLFKHYGVRPTAMRLFIWKQIEQTEHPFSLGDMELWLDTVDKSTIFRTLTLFEEQGLLHSLDDGSGQKNTADARWLRYVRVTNTNMSTITPCNPI